MDEANEEDDGEVPETAASAPFYFHPRTGKIGRSGFCLPEVRLSEDDETGSKRLVKCKTCGGNCATDQDVVTEFFAGDFALSAVVTDTLYQELPGKSGTMAAHKDGRKLLVFSDNRQDGRFAPYLHYTSQDLHIRWAICQTLNAVRMDFH